MTRSAIYSVSAASWDSPVLPAFNTGPVHVPGLQRGREFRGQEFRGSFGSFEDRRDAHFVGTDER
jgi:hypothetical protein